MPVDRTTTDKNGPPHLPQTRQSPCFHCTNVNPSHKACGMLTLVDIFVGSQVLMRGGIRISHLPLGDGVILDRSPISHWETDHFQQNLPDRKSRDKYSQPLNFSVGRRDWEIFIAFAFIWLMGRVKQHITSAFKLIFVGKKTTVSRLPLSFFRLFPVWVAM